MGARASRITLVGTRESSQAFCHRFVYARAVALPARFAVTVIDKCAKEHLHDHLRWVRESLVWKLDGLGEYDVRRPLTATGTNLLGLVKHLAVWESRYFGEVFSRPFPEPLPRWDDEAANDAAFWATEHETRAEITGLYQRVWEHTDATISTLAIDAPGYVPWWRAGREAVQHHCPHALRYHPPRRPRRHPARATRRRHRDDRREHGPGRTRQRLLGRPAREGRAGRQGSRSSRRFIATALNRTSSRAQSHDPGANHVSRRKPS